MAKWMLGQGKWKSLDASFCFYKQLQVHSLQFDIQIKRFKGFNRFEFCISQRIYSQSKKRSQ